LLFAEIENRFPICNRINILSSSFFKGKSTELVFQTHCVWHLGAGEADVNAAPWQRRQPLQHARHLSIRLD